MQTQRNSRAIRFLAGPVLIGAGLLVVGGCNSQRPLGVVRASGNDAYAAGDFQHAESEFREVVERHRESSLARYDLARTLSARGQHAAAADELEIAMRISPRTRLYADAYAEELHQAGRGEELDVFLRLRTTNDGRPADYLRLAKYSEALGSPDEAHEAYLRAAAVDGGTGVEPQLALADFYRRIGDEGAELRRLRAVLYLDPENEVAAARLREMGQVPGPTLAKAPPELDIQD